LELKRETFGDFSLRQNTLIWHSEAHPGRNQYLTWDYTFSDVSQDTTGQPTNNYNTHDATLSHSLDFGSQKQNNLLSLVNYFNQSGDFSLERFHWNEYLRLHHTRNFDTRYIYTLDQQSFLGDDQLTNRGVAGFTHRLYKSLVTNGNVGVQQITRSDGGDSFEYFGDLHFDYTKSVPFGLLTAFVGGAYDWRDNQAQSNPTQVTNAPFTFNDQDQITIAAQHIDPNSIRVKSADGKRVFDVNEAYTVETLPGGVRLTRIEGGPIAVRAGGVDRLPDRSAGTEHGDHQELHVRRAIRSEGGRVTRAGCLCPLHQAGSEY
jgi:hypothetical protein